jgi:mannose-1-phosphate guanylyltransferase
VTSPRKLWAIVLAGGEGSRLRPVMTEVYGIDVPKQYCAFKGHEPLVRMALRRAMMLTARERVVTIVSDHHRQWWEPILSDLPRDNILVQPCNRGTACGLLLPLVHVLLEDPHAVVVVLPSDHYVDDEAVFGRTVRKAVKVVRDAADSIVLLGIRPDRPDSEYGWIEPTLTALGGVHWVLSFIEKPVPAVAEQLMQRGGLWNTFVFVAQGLALLATFANAFPELVERFGAIWVNRNQGNIEKRLARLYDNLPSLDLSRDLLQPNHDNLRVLPVPPCGWADLGTPERVARCLERMGGDAPIGRIGYGSSPPHLPDLAAAVSSYAQRLVSPPTSS